ncbi:MIP/aquaporin family protein [Nesterenkonia lacusekhoensis]|uniref:Glycerol uptake facilitator protein n=1 Tax=Nesterenkonia lacusekhoensis TaxID=150832 RepID=A0ABS4SYC4_9MICC|nr:glycerol uptake facilitator protein [Nesterenkonia lacusekhoensis]
METIFLFEIMGTATLVLLGTGVVANALLPGAKGNGGGPLMIHWGWGLAVFAGVYVGWASGAHLNPAVTVGLFVSGENEFAPGIAADVPAMLAYFTAQLIGAFLGALVAWLVYKKQYDGAEDAAVIRSTFCTDPAERSYGWNWVTETVATYIFVLVVLLFGATPTELGPLEVGLLVVAIGACLGGPTGYAINPVRDLGPRLAHALLPIRHKGGSDWAYAWVPIVGPVTGGLAAGLTAPVMLAG